MSRPTVAEVTACMLTWLPELEYIEVSRGILVFQVNFRVPGIDATLFWVSTRPAAVEALSVNEQECLSVLAAWNENYRGRATRPGLTLFATGVEGGEE